jgi:hypothetical protein
MREDDNDGSPRTKWSRSQRFELSRSGREAAESYREGIVAARADPGRRSFDAARDGWAERLALEPADGLYLGELKAGPRTLDEITNALDGCGPERAEVRKAFVRLVKLGIVTLVVPPAEPPPPPYVPRRW